MITPTTSSDNKALKAIWIEVFDEVGVNDLDAEYYADTFLLYHRHHSGLAYREEGKIVSMLFLVPCSWDGVAGYYVYACATLPQCRGKGYMKALLDAAFEKAQNEKAFGLILIPATLSLFDFYGKHGFQTFSHIAEHTFYEKDAVGCGFDCVKSYDVAMITDLRNRFYEERFAVQFGFSHIRHIQNQMANEHGATLVFDIGEKRGYAFCLYNPLDRSVQVFEWAVISDDINAKTQRIYAKDAVISDALHDDIPRFFKGICRYFDVSELWVRSRSGLNLGSERPFSMVRLCAAKRLPEHTYFNLGMD